MSSNFAVQRISSVPQEFATPVRVVRASALGLCFGVVDALAAMRAVERPDEVTIWGELVHNPRVGAELVARGFTLRSESERDLLPTTPVVLVTAHGISDRERGRLESSGARLVDTTCPLVRNVHVAAQRLARDGRFVVVIGRAGHVEIRGIVEDLDRFAVVGSAAEVRDFGEPRIGVVFQTTTAPDEGKRLVAAIRAANPESDVEVVRTICSPTRDRQAAMGELAQRVDAVVVVGGKHSNNTRRLAALAEARGLPVLHVESAAEVDPDWVIRYGTIGLTAGTSTLPETVDEVERAIRGVDRSPVSGASGGGRGGPAPLRRT